MAKPVFMEARILTAFSVVVYNIAGIIALYFRFNDIALHGEWAGFTEIVTYPVTFFSYIYLLIHTEPFYPVFIIQIAMLGITLLVADAIVRYAQKREKRKNS
ncbi:hypothetical protein LJC00_03115 [Dysgonomonas sp. OttesenSCG-928-M03]|nr:hypothetical protein [Dysgonomonas sp. OttesenSCG-928-M03]